MEHIPDVGLGDIKEEDENEIHNESEHVLDKEGGPKGLTVNQDGAISDETDSEFPRKSLNCTFHCVANFSKRFKILLITVYSEH